MNTESTRPLLIAGGICAILWPVLSLAFYGLYPIAAGGATPGVPLAGGPAAQAQRWAALGRNLAVVTLEWANVAFSLLLLPFFLALHRLLGERGQRDLTLVAIGLGFLGVSIMVLSGTYNARLLHSLGQAYVDAGSQAEGAAILSVALALANWMRGLNQLASLLYQGFVALTGLALIRSRTWRTWGWVGLVGALLALPAKLSIQVRVPTNFIWTGLAYFVWPLEMGIKLLRHTEE